MTGSAVFLDGLAHPQRGHDGVSVGIEDGRVCLEFDSGARGMCIHIDADVAARVAESLLKFSKQLSQPVCDEQDES